MAKVSRKVNIYFLCSVLAVTAFVVVGGCLSLGLDPCEGGVSEVDVSFSDPHPPVGQQWVYLDVRLRWTMDVEPSSCETPGGCYVTVYRYPLTFTIYMGKSQTALSPIGSFSARDESSRSTEWYYDLKEKGKRLEPNTTYYWQVEVKVSHGTDEKPLETTVKSPIWSFKTGYDVRP